MTKTDAFLGDTSIRDLVAKGHVRTRGPGMGIEPASIDIRVEGGQTLVPISFLPVHDESIEDTLRDLKMAEVAAGTRIMPGAPYVTIVRLAMDLDLPADVKAVFSPTSSIGRLDLQVRVMADRSNRYDETPFGYRGALYAEVTSWSFPISIGPANATFGAPLTQIRFVRCANPKTGCAPDTLLRTQTLSIGMKGDNIGWIADASDPGRVITLGESKDLPIRDYWRPLHANKRGIILRRGTFYIAASAENVVVQSDECAILRQIDTTLSQAQVHGAGYADPFYGVEHPSLMVYEIRNNGPDMLVREGQPVAILETHRLDRPAEVAYGEGRESYQGQRVRLSRCFGPH